MVAPIDAAHFRHTLGYLPTGVTVITSIGPLGEPVGMSCNSFTSVSLDPPLVLFCADKCSVTGLTIRQAGHFNVNVLGHGNERVSRQFSTKNINRFSGIRWSESPTGPELDTAIAWISCMIDAEYVAGDHVIVVARVVKLTTNGDGSLPLVFHNGIYGSFSAAEERHVHRRR